MHRIDMDNRDYIIGIDVGSSSVIMAVGVRNDNGDVSVLGVDVQEVDGSVKDGDIINYIELGNAIARAKSALEGELGRRLNSAYIGVSGRSVYCVRYEDYVEISEKTGCVTENELRELNARIEMVMPGGGDEIVDRIPLRYSIDDRQEVKNPLGAFGRKLSATYLFVMVGKQQIDRLNKALFRADIKVSGLCVNPTLLPQVVLGEEERESGVAIVDIGSDLTDISIVRDGKLWYYSSLPIGASSINNDLHDFLRAPKRDIEIVKRKYGSAMADGVPENTTVPIKTAGNAKKQILQRNIAEIAEERLKDIASFVARELKATNFFTKLPCGVVLTGGTSYLSNIDQLFARELQMEARVSTMLYGLDDESQMKVSAYTQSVVAGLLLYGAGHTACETQPDNNKHKESTPLTPATEEPIDIFSGGGQSGVTNHGVPEEPNKHDKEEDNTLNDTIPIGNNEEVEEKTNGADKEKPEEPEESDKPKQEEAAQVEHRSQEQKSGWLNRFRIWVDDMFTDEYI